MVGLFSREKKALNELITCKWFDLVKKHAALDVKNYVFDDLTKSIAIEVLKSLCNLVFNSTIAAAMCCKNGVLTSLANRVKNFQTENVPPEVTFFDIKLLFLLTALCHEERNRVKDDMDGITSLINILDFIMKKSVKDSSHINLNVIVFVLLIFY